MLDFNEKTATEGVLKSFSSIKNERLKELMSSIVTHLHEVVKETEPTFDEWLTAIEFLTRTCLLYTSPSPRDLSTSRMPSSA